ncbi:hypothetical protein PTI98_001970 [Pleurotus ostreatus]|nr:hypothetical protein PTI98_001970 [Pleurotus ostreatus]
MYVAFQKLRDVFNGGVQSAVVKVEGEFNGRATGSIAYTGVARAEAVSPYSQGLYGTYNPFHLNTSAEVNGALDVRPSQQYAEHIHPATESFRQHSPIITETRLRGAVRALRSDHNPRTRKREDNVPSTERFPGHMEGPSFELRDMFEEHRNERRHIPSGVLGCRLHWTERRQILPAQSTVFLLTTVSPNSAYEEPVPIGWLIKKTLAFEVHDSG